MFIISIKDVNLMKYIYYILSDNKELDKLKTGVGIPNITKGTLETFKIYIPSTENLKERSKEITHVEEILKEAIYEFQHINRIRKVEIAMREVPMMVKDIKATAVNHVFKNELESLNSDSREVLEKIMEYMEKKYMSVPMKMAKEILLKQEI